MDNNLISAASQIGFPIVVSLYFIVTLNKTLSSLVMAVKSLEKAVDVLTYQTGGSKDD